MKITNILKIVFLLGSVGFFSSCSSDSSGPKNQDDFIVQVLSAADSSAILNANVVLYNADNNEAVTRDATNSDGKCTFDVDAGNYYVKISAQSFKSSPPANNAPIPFAVTENEDVTRTIYLNPLQTLQPGQIAGNVNPVINNVLIIAGETGGVEYTTVTGPDGYFITDLLRRSLVSVLKIQAQCHNRNGP